MTTEFRLAALERSNRRLKTAVMIPSAIVGVGLVGGARHYPKHIHASGITITGGDGHNVYHLGTSRDGDAHLRMHDRRGSPRIIVTAKSEYGVVGFVDSNMELAGCIFGDDVTETLTPAERMKADK